MDNAADRKSIREAEKRAKLVDRQRAEVLINLMSTMAGRQWVWDMLESCHVFTPSYSDDAMRMAFNEGERNRGLALLADVMQWCSDQFIQAMREANERRTQRASPTGKRPSSEDGDGGDQGPDPDPGDPSDA